MVCEERGTRRLVRPAMLAGLAAGILCLTAACGGASSTSSAAAGRTATPTPSIATATPAPSATTASPAASSPSASSSGSSDGSSASPVTAGPASAAQVAAFTAAANGHCGFSSSAYTLTGAEVTNNGWGAATVTARNPADQGNATMIFQMGTGGWTYVECGSSFTGGSIPQDVLNALNLR